MRNVGCLASVPKECGINSLHSPVYFAIFQLLSTSQRSFGAKDTGEGGKCGQVWETGWKCGVEMKATAKADAIFIISFFFACPLGGNQQFDCYTRILSLTQILTHTLSDSRPHRYPHKCRKTHIPFAWSNILVR